MEFHPDKCKLLRITNKLKPKEASYYMHNHKLDIVGTGKYLGVLLNKKLSWKPHVDAICKKATQTRAFLQRNLKDCQREVKSRCYKMCTQLWNTLPWSWTRLVKEINTYDTKLKWCNIVQHDL